MSCCGCCTGDDPYIETFLATHRYYTDSVSLMKRFQTLYVLTSNGSRLLVWLVSRCLCGYFTSYLGIHLEGSAMDADSFRACRAKQAAIRQKWALPKLLS